MYIHTFNIDEHTLVDEHAYLIYRKVTPVWHAGKCPNGFSPEGRKFLYEDYSPLLKPGDVFYEIVLLNVEPSHRLEGLGSKLVKQFFDECQPTSVVLSAGITTEELYDRLCNDPNPNALMSYLLDNQVKFWEKQGFTNVNNTTFYAEQSVPMLWPNNMANTAINRTNNFNCSKET